MSCLNPDIELVDLETGVVQRMLLPVNISHVLVFLLDSEV